MIIEARDAREDVMIDVHATRRHGAHHLLCGVRQPRVPGEHEFAECVRQPGAFQLDELFDEERDAAAAVGEHLDGGLVEVSGFRQERDLLRDFGRAERPTSIRTIVRVPSSSASTGRSGWNRSTSSDRYVATMVRCRPRSVLANVFSSARVAASAHCRSSITMPR